MHRSLILMMLAVISAACSPAPEEDPEVVLLSLDLAPVTEQLSAGAIFSAWAGDDSMWLVGGRSGKSLVLEYDGSGWTTHEPKVDQQLWWVHGVGGERVITVGAGGVISSYDGLAWTPMDSGAPTSVLYGVWGAAPDDVWAVGGVWQAAPAGVDSEGDVIIHYDGTSWSRVEIPYLATKPESAQKDLFKVWGASPDRVFVVGSGGLALHWDGATWEKRDTGFNEVLFTVAGRSESDVWAVGGYIETRLIHWDGAAWSHVDVPEFAPQQSPGLWPAPGHAVYIAGLNGYVARRDPDGTWHESDFASPESFHAVHSDGQGLWAVGGDILNLNPDHGANAYAGPHPPPTP